MEQMTTAKPPSLRRLLCWERKRWRVLIALFVYKMLKNSEGLAT